MNLDMEKGDLFDVKGIMDRADQETRDYIRTLAKLCDTATDMALDAVLYCLNRVMENDSLLNKLSEDEKRALILQQIRLKSV